MLQALLRSLPLATFAPFRRAVVALPRGHLLRSGSVALLKRAAASRRASLFGEVSEVRPLDMPHFSFAPTNSMVVEAIYWFGVEGYEGRLAQVWADLCRPAQAVLEIGGNIGLFTVLGAAVTGGRYRVVEPVPAVARVLAGNLARNGLADRVELLEAAVIPQGPPRDIALNIPAEDRDAPVGAHLVEGVEVSGRSTERLLTVRGLPIADLIGGCDVLKIDAEGIEAELLAAAHDTLVAARPSIVVELLPEATALAARVARLAREAGYVIQVVPAYGAQEIVTVPPEAFSAAVPAQHRSKDVVLTRTPIV